MGFKPRCTAAPSFLDTVALGPMETRDAGVQPCTATTSPWAQEAPRDLSGSRVDWLPMTQAHPAGKQACPKDPASSFLAARHPRGTGETPGVAWPQVWTLEPPRPGVPPAADLHSIRRACLEEEERATPQGRGTMV